MTTPRSKIMSPHREGVFHCISRCVRRAKLCGADPVTKKNYDHRKDWIYSKMKELAGIFMIDVCGYAIMSNHFHIILRNRPDLVAASSDDEIARRWLALFPKKRDGKISIKEAEVIRIEQITNDPQRLEVLRENLSSISWFMRCLKEPIARRANQEDDCTGSFWEGRFKSIALLDGAAILTCSAYVDLNPIRAGLAQAPEHSLHTSIHERIKTRHMEKASSLGKVEFGVVGRGNKLQPSTSSSESCSQWLAPLLSEKGRRGFLNIGLEDYMELVDWTGRQLVEGKKGSIPNQLEPILDRLKINVEYWHESTNIFSSLFYLAAGTKQSMSDAAAKVGQTCFKRRLMGWAVFQ